MLHDEPNPSRDFCLDRPPAAAGLSLHALLRSVMNVLPPPLGCSREAARMGGGGATAGDEAAPPPLAPRAAADCFCRCVTIPTTFFERRRSSRSCAIVGVWK